MSDLSDLCATHGLPIFFFFFYFASERGISVNHSNSHVGAIVGYGSLSLPFSRCVGWSGGAMVLGKLPVPGRPTIWITLGQGPTALAVGASGGLFGHFYSHLSFLSSFSISLGDGPI